MKRYNRRLDKSSSNYFIVPAVVGFTLFTLLPAYGITLEGFEIPVLPPNGSSASPSGGNWQFSGTSGGGIQRNGHVPGATAAPDGRQTAYLKGGNSKTSTKVYLENGEYTVSFYAAKGSQDAGNPLQVKINGNPIGPAITPKDATFQRYTTTAFPIGTSNTYTLEILSSTSAPATHMSLVDAVSITKKGVKEPITIKIMPNDIEGTIRSDLSTRTYGGGFESVRAEIRMMMNDYNSASPIGRQETAKAIMNLRLGTLRFPNGDSSFLYVWDYPDGSFQETTGGNDTTKQLTPDEIIKFTQNCLPTSSGCKPQLNMDRLFEVNTVFWRNFNDNWTLNYLDNNANKNPPELPSLNTENLNKAAIYAAKWVKADSENPLGKTLYWEVGNEDWYRWKAEDYAKIYYTFQEEMRNKRHDIRLLAQGLASDVVTSFGTNTPKDWLKEISSKLQASGAPSSSVYAYSIHKYLKAGLYKQLTSDTERRQRQTQEMFAFIAAGEPINTVKGLLSSSPFTSDWKIWVTEFNVIQPKLNNNNKLVTATLQDMGHALVIADWTGKMLEQNVERVFMHSLDHNKETAIVAYDNLLGVNLEHPRVHAPGYAYARYAQEFGNIMLRNTTINNIPINTKNENNAVLSYPQLSVYSSMTSDKKSLRVMVINRDLSTSIDINLNTLNVPGFKLSNAQYGMRSLSAPNITASNLSQTDAVKWTDWKWAAQTETTGISNVRLAPASVNLFIIPIQTGS